MKNEILEQYQELNIERDKLQFLNEKLKLPDEHLLKSAKTPRLESVKEAMSWEKGPDQENRNITELYHLLDEYTLCVAKPGREAAPDYKGLKFYAGEKEGEETNNPNDMLPMILKSGEKVDEKPTMEDIFEAIMELSRTDPFGLEIAGMLFFRQAFMLDHQKNGEGNWRYHPSEEVIELLEERAPTVSEIPIRVYLYFLELLALNEDVKVYTLGYDEQQGYGRVNTLLTFAHLAAVLLNRRPLSMFAGSFARPPSGMAPLPRTKVDQYFPLLTIDWPID